MRSRQHVVTVRLNDDEYATYKRILIRAILYDGAHGVKTDSDAFRAVLHRINVEL
jgi:hypothetical protein